MKRWQRKTAAFLVAPAFWFGACGVAIHAHEHGQFQAERRGMQAAVQKVTLWRLETKEDMQLAALTPECYAHDANCVLGVAAAMGYVEPKPKKGSKQ